MSKVRSDYLQNLWIKYPEAPRGFLQYGRILNFRLGTHQVHDYKLKDAPQIKASEVLGDGDLVALFPQNLILLLAPNLTEHSGFYPPADHPWLIKKNYYEYIQQLRKFFTEKRFLEVKTPTLVPCPGTEPSLDVFSSLLEIGSKKEKLYLITSPELHHKKLLSYGAEKIFEIASVFRNGEETEKHAYQFTMLEWYRAMAQLSSIRHDAIELVEFMCDHFRVEKPKEVLTFTVAELFKKFCDFELTPQTTLEELKVLAERLHVDVQSAESIDDYFYLIFLEKIENQWPQDRLVFVEKYPPYQAALARLDSQGWAERFEIYWKGVELANAFHELNDPEIQRQRSLQDLEQKKLMNKEIVNLDEEFFRALHFGMPPSAGIALGVERLFMVLFNVKSIDKIVKYSL